MATLDNQNLQPTLQAENFTPEGAPATQIDEVSLVVNSFSKSESFVTSKQWNLLWADADILYQSPRALSSYAGSYLLEPNVQRFTVAKAVNSVVPQFYKGLFYDDPPFVLRPRPGTTQETIYAKKAIFASLLDEMEFQRECKYGLEQMALLGTGIYKWGVSYKTIRVPKRKSQKITLPGAQGKSEAVYSSDEPEIEYTEKKVCVPTFEFRDIRNVFVDPKCELPDIREAGYVIDQRWVNFYDLQTLRDDKDYEIPADNELKTWFQSPSEANRTPGQSSVEQMTVRTGVVHHSDPQNAPSANPLMEKLELLEYWDRERSITVINRAHGIRCIENKFRVIPFLSSNYWNRSKALYGMGIGLLAGSDQRLQQGTVNSALKILSLAVNTPYLTSGDSNMPSQMIQTGLGRILRVTDLDKSYKLLETPKVPSDIWPVLQEDKQNTDATTGADQMLVQGSTAGPRSSMGRTAGGAGILAGASATRLDGPLDNFIDQVFVPWLYIMDQLVFEHMSDAQIMDILGEELGKEFEIDLEVYHAGRVEFDVLAGARLSAKTAMAQSLVLLMQLFENPNIQSQLAEINGEFIDFKPVLKMALEVSGWGSGIENDIFRPLTAEMKQQLQGKHNAASKLQAQMTLSQQRFQQKEQLEDQATDNRIKRDIFRDAVKAAGLNMAVTGQPSENGYGSDGQQVV
jgi:hypothetical protein